MPPLRALSLLMICLLTAAVPGRADPLPALGLKERQSWTAVGLVNHAGYRDRATCTGALIAPDLVLTAAHCASDTRHFVAGWDRGSFAAHRKSVQAIVHPNYQTATGNDRFRYDIAVLRLSDPINPRAITPLRLDDQARLRRGDLTLLGYHKLRPHVLNGRDDCPSLSPPAQPILVVGCEVISGNSGGPVLARTQDGWVVVAVLVGRAGGANPRALAVPVDAWLMTQWQYAMARAEASAQGG